MSQPTALAPEALPLPKCSGCLRTFLACAACYRFLCGHFYCSLCAAILQRPDGLFRCLFDGKTTTEEELKQSEGLREMIGVKWGEGPEVVKRLLGTVNYGGVPCRDLFKGGMCNQAADCPYSHTPASMEVLNQFQRQEDATCWECRHCLLTLARKLTHCPVCNSLQTHLPLHFPDHKDPPTQANQTCDQSMQTEEERPGRRSVQVPASLPVGRSACCCVQ